MSESFKYRYKSQLLLYHSGLSMLACLIHWSFGVQCDFFMDTELNITSSTVQQWPHCCQYLLWMPTSDI